MFVTGTATEAGGRNTPLARAMPLPSTMLTKIRSRSLILDDLPAAHACDSLPSTIPFQGPIGFGNPEDTMHRQVRPYSEIGWASE